MRFFKMVNRKFLIVKMSAIGDILHSLNVAQYLKRKFSDALVVWVTEKRFEGLVGASPYVDEVIAIDMKALKLRPIKLLFSLYSFRKLLRKHTYDVLFDLQGNCKSALMTLLAKAFDKVGFKNVAEWPNLLVTRTKFDIDPTLQIEEQYVSLVKSYYQDTQETSLDSHILKETEKFPEEWLMENTLKKIMICPGSHWKNKQLSEETLVVFLRHLEKEYYPHFVFIWGQEKEKEQAIRLAALYPNSKVVGALPWALWQSLMRKMDCVIAVDSCALQLAALAGVPTFSIYGPSSSKVYKPLGEKHHSYQGGCPYGEVFTKRCRVLRRCSTGACIKDISPLSLLSSFKKFWTSSCYHKEND